jgi:hypothetical protein
MVGLRNSVALSKSSLWRALRLALASCAILAGGLALTPAVASARAPLIGPVSAGAGFYGEGLIETQVDPEGYETTYEISADCEVPALCQHTEGTLPADNEEHPISLELAGLKPGVTYHFEIYATSNAGEMNWPGEFTAPVIPPGACPNGCSSSEGFKAVPGEWTRSDQEEADRATAEAEAERHRAKEQEEQKGAAEAAVKYASEAAALKKREEEEATTQQPAGNVALAGNAITVQGGGVSLVKLTCLGSASCQGRLTLSVTITSKVKGTKKPVRTVSIGTASFSVAGDEAKAVKVKLNIAGRALLSIDHGRLSASLTILESSPSPSQTHTENVQLVRQKAHGHAKK